MPQYSCRITGMHRLVKRRWWKCLALLAFASALLLVLQRAASRPVRNRLDFQVHVEGSDIDREKRRAKPNDDTRTPVTDKKVCNVPKLEMNGAEVIQFFTESKPFVCDQDENWAFIHDGRFSIIPAKRGAACEISTIMRVSDDEVQYGVWQSIRSGAALPSDFVRVRCSLGWRSWSGNLMSVVQNDEAIKRARSRRQPDDWSGLDVYFLGFDSVSQLTFRRKLPKTVAFLENVMEAVVLDAYNIVGDGTPQAFIPILTGGTEEELPLTRKRFSNASYVDDVYPFIWRNFSDAGYITTYGEDLAYLGTFTYRLKGFRNQPTDHYTRTFYQEHENAGNTFCSGSVQVYQDWFRYCKEFMKVYTGMPRFLLMHLAMFSHDDVNLVGVLDDDLAAHLEYMHENGYFDKALVIVMADHGHRFAALRNTHQGQIEERLPFFSLALPKSLREGRMKQAWRNVLHNKDILSTPFDIHATLNDVLHFPSDEQLSTVQNASSRRSLSLFRPLPISRTCEQAGADAHWCTCLNWEEAIASQDDEVLVEAIAAAVVQVFNDQTKSERSLCSHLNLTKLIYAKKMLPNKDLLKYKSVKDVDGFVPDLTGRTEASIVFYQIKLATTPGDAEYEVTLRHEVLTNTLFIDLKSISHATAYGDRPHCIIDKNYFLATFCVCYDRI